MHRYLISLIWLSVISASPVKVELNGLGTVHGERYTEGLQRFLGIPFAAPPLGKNRFRPAQPPKPWGSLDATKYGAPCLQAASFWVPYPSNTTSEDCLYLNVWAQSANTTGATTAKQKLPVLVYIHGGANLAGTGAMPQYNGTHFAGKGVVLVTLNYRLGVFGQLAWSQLAEEATTLTSQPPAYRPQHAHSTKPDLGSIQRMPVFLRPAA